MRKKGFRLLTFVTFLMVALVVTPITVDASSNDSTDDSTSVSSDGEE